MRIIFKYFTVFILLEILVHFAYQRLILTDDLYFNTFIDHIEFSRLESLIKGNKESRWLIYIFIPVIIFLQTLFIYVFISLALFFENKKYYSVKLFVDIILGHFIFSGAKLIKIFWLLPSSENLTLSDVGNFAPLSLLTFFDKMQLEKWQVYPLMMANLAQILFVLFVSFRISTQSSLSFGVAFRLVSISYFTLLIFWIVFVVFISISLLN